MSCRLADFGLSRVLDMNATHVSTQSFGTVPYMPPELLSQGRMTTKVDVYSFAILSARLLRRAHGFSRASADMFCTPWYACQPFGASGHPLR
jgi:serine/threonine protein kinase